MTVDSGGKDLNLAQGLIDLLEKTQYQDLPDQAVRHCKLLLMDTFGVGLAGVNAPGCQQVAGLAGEWGGSGAKLLISGRSAAPPLAALANSTMMHALDFDDTLDASALHCFVSVLPAALATAQAVGGVDGKRFIRALVLGVEVICRVSRSITTPLSWIRTSTCGSFGAAAAAASVLGLDRDGLANALGVVYAQTSGNAQGLMEGRLVKRMQPGFAAQAGVNSAFLARAGITGSREFLEGAYGFFNLYEKGQYDTAPALESLNQEFLINELSIKPYPSCRMTHSAIDAALELHPRLTKPAGEVESIQVEVSKMSAEMVGKPFVMGTNPQVDAQFSIPYTVSVALTRGDVFLDDFEIQAIENPRIMELAKKVSVKVDPNLPDNDLMEARVSLVQDGSELSARTSAPLGNPAKPMSLEDCQAKFRKCLNYSGLDLDPARVEQFLDQVENLQDCPDVSVLPGLLEV